MLTQTAVEAALRGDEALPSRIDSISVGMPQVLKPDIPPQIPTSPRPLKPSHSSTSNGRHSSQSSQPAQRSRTEPLPPPPVGRQRAEIAPPPLPSRATSPGDSSPVVASGNQDSSGPPLPGRRGPSSQRLNQARRPQPQKQASSISLQGSDSQSSIEDPSPPSSSRNEVLLPSGPLLPPRHTSVAPSPPLPPNRPGPQRAGISQKPESKASPPSRPPPAGNRPKPSLPTKPKGISPQQPPKPSKPMSRGSSRADESSSGIPTGDGMTPREMLDTAKQQIPKLLLAISNRSSGIPQNLENIAALCENIANKARCSGVRYRVVTSSLRGELSTLRENAHVSWHTNADRLCETLNTVLGHVNSLSEGLIE